MQHGNAVRQKWLDLFDLIAEGKTKQRPPNFEVPDRELPCRFNVQPGTWFARDNVFNFILFCRKLGNFLYYTLCTYYVLRSEKNAIVRSQTDFLKYLVKSIFLNFRNVDFGHLYFNPTLFFSLLKLLCWINFFAKLILTQNFASQSASHYMRPYLILN